MIYFFLPLLTLDRVSLICFLLLFLGLGLTVVLVAAGGVGFLNPDFVAAAVTLIF
jgi:hypothetical protein